MVYCLIKRWGFLSPLSLWAHTEPQHEESGGTKMGRQSIESKRERERIERVYSALLWRSSESHLKLSPSLNWRFQLLSVAWLKSATVPVRNTSLDFPSQMNYSMITIYSDYHQLPLLFCHGGREYWTKTIFYLQSIVPHLYHNDLNIFYLSLVWQGGSHWDAKLLPPGFQDDSKKRLI